MTSFSTHRRRLMRILPVLALTVAGCAGGSGTATNQTDAEPGPPSSSAATTNAVVYEVTGPGPVAWIKYVTDGKTTTIQEDNVPLPWTKSFSLPVGQGPQQISLLVLNRGEVTASIMVNGRLVNTNTSFGGSGDDPMYLTGQI
ncbi:hypothetical protein [Saccharothrix deserti]|uniref:hypothetical protein n=1 Tax=Saccharothrix deserti TaxID=2593674 RepID=UPI00131B59F8|nr:hypothetical protein [Saccharothrix deserti]